MRSARPWLQGALGVLASSALWAVSPAARAEPLPVAGGAFAPFFAGESDAPIPVAPFLLDRAPVTNASFARFVEAQPAWAPGAPPTIFADINYLKHWGGHPVASILPGSALGDQPVTWVSWFAAAAYCEAAGGRLPGEAEWELAASPPPGDAAAEEALTQQLLRWYAQPGSAPLGRVGAQAPDRRGFQDLHGLIWEWIADFNASMVAGARRGANERVLGLFCGGASVSARDPRDYATFMRYALRSSLTGRYTTRNLGFRCAYDGEMR